MANRSIDSVTFTGVLKSYPPGEKLDVSYFLNYDLAPASRDWVGLFRVGWSSSRDYYTFEWAPPPTSGKGSVTFAGRRLPPQDKHFYQFCFVSSDGRVRGASSPFQFSSTAAQDDHIKAEHHESETRLMENLEKKRALAHKLTTIDEAQVRQRLQEVQATLPTTDATTEGALAATQVALATTQVALATTQVALATTQALAASQGAKDTLQAEVAELSRRNQESEEKLAQHPTETNQSQEMHVEQMKSKHQECKDKLQEMERSHQEEMETSHAETDRLAQEVAVAQTNIAELGAKDEGIVVDIPPTANQETPTLPATHVNMVDKSAYEALQQAYENIEEMYHKGSQENRDWRTRFMDMRAKHDAVALRNAELEQRIIKCKDEYTAKAHELVELKRNLHGSNGGDVGVVASSLTDLAALQARICEVAQSWEKMEAETYERIHKANHVSMVAYYIESQRIQRHTTQIKAKYKQVHYRDERRYWYSRYMAMKAKHTQAFVWNPLIVLTGLAVLRFVLK